MSKSIKKGSSLILIILVTSVLIILTTSLLSLSYSDTKNSVYQNDKVQAHYIGRSGIDVGKKILDEQILNGNFATIDSIVSSANSYVSGLEPVIKDVTGTKTIGSFTLKYEKSNPDEIKIISTANIPKNPAVKDTVTYTVKIGNTVTFDDISDWFTGINLQKNYNNSTPKKGAKLGGKKVQSPKNGGASTFRSEIIYFLNNDDNSSFRQVTNSIDVTFDAFIIYAEGKFILNKTNDAVNFTTSNTVLTSWNIIDNSFNTTYENYGFESFGRYKDFVRNYETNDALLHSFHDSYHLDTNFKYGIVYFGGNIVDDKDVAVYTPTGSRYYFFKTGVNLHDIKSGDLILINDDDPIIKAVKSYFKYKTDTTGSLWNNK